MAIDNKYGRVTLEHGSIGEDEPVVVFRAQDVFLPQVLEYYLMFCLQGGSPKRHISLILNTREGVLKWQEENQTKVPTSDHIWDRWAKGASKS